MQGTAASDVDDNRFCLGVTDDNDDLRFHLRLQDMGTFCFDEVLEEDVETTFELMHFLPLRTLNFLWVLLGRRPFLFLHAHSISFSAHSFSVILCLILFSQVVLSYSSLG